ncbi:MAG: class II fumarate hydratase [Gammaproteobacteria bacterium]|nr:class II fumarate hydratase [Gammaproteobacteria bacterium]
MAQYRIEKDSMGELQVPADALYGAQTQRAVNNFSVSGLPLPAAFIRALGLVKAACAEVNRDAGELDSPLAKAIIAAAEELAAGKYYEHFPIDVFQTGSATSTNMNANEVIAHLAARAGVTVHANDHVNMGQSSNDVIPTAIHVSAVLETTQKLLPALQHLKSVVEQRAAELDDVVLTGRTHLMDAMPVRLSQELGGWAAQIGLAMDRLKAVMPRISALALGGTAVGTGVNARADFGDKVAMALSRRTKLAFTSNPNKFEALSAQDAAVELSGQLKTLAVSLMKISNDLRWMNSGPLAGLGEIALPGLQPGSSIMPGKVNPVIPESVAMVCAQVIGNDVTITIGGQSGNFQLNVMLPVIAYNLLQSIEILSNASRMLADKAIAGFTVNRKNIEATLGRNPILVTALNPVIGYELGAKIAKTAYAQGRAVMDVAEEMTELSREELERLLNPHQLTLGGIQK